MFTAPLQIGVAGWFVHVQKGLLLQRFFGNRCQNAKLTRM